MADSHSLDASADLDVVRRKVTTCLEEFLGEKARQASALGAASEVPLTLRQFITAGGKRIRPLLCVMGWQAAGGSGSPETVIRLAAALELYQAFALIHDDVIDQSATRRSQPAVHRALADRYAAARETDHLGVSAAILIGNMALTWSDELVTEADIAPSRRVLVGRVLDAMREEMHYGQYLDLLAPLGALEDQQLPLTVARFKTAKYTVERPLHVGATLAGADTALLGLLSRFALPLGEAFQLRDDLLGVLGDAATTGKPVLDDLREGKRTVLLAIAAQRADPGQRSVLRRWVGDPLLDEEGASAVRSVLKATDAPAAVEKMIAVRYEESLAVLKQARIPSAAASALERIASLSIHRDA
ncbi:polyprenyl synthetase family protein [Streptomyces sp. V2]|nr:polyprenyl synthetase family protein [Streptomyces sp. V2]